MVEGYTGRPGAGKTLNMVDCLWRAKQRGRAVYANIPLIDTRERKRTQYLFGKFRINPVCEQTYGKNWTDGPMLTKLDEVLSLDNGIVALDEVHMWLGSDAWEAIDFSVRQFLAQQRKIGVDIWWTAQSNARVFNVIRELTACVWDCQRYGPFMILNGQDPKSKEVMGRRYRYVSPLTYHLYNTEYMVGSADGSSEGRIGHNRRYDKLRRERSRELVRAEGGWGSWARYRWDDDGQELPPVGAPALAGDTGGALLL